MPLLELLLRSCKLIFVFAFVPVVSGVVLYGPSGAIVAGVLVLGLLLLGYFFSSQFFLKQFRSSPASATMLKSLELAITGLEHQPPELVVVPSVSLCALALRDGSGKRLLILSQGLLAGLSEEELRAVLEFGTLIIDEKGTSFRCLSALIAMFLSKIAPRAWNELFLEGKEPVDSNPRNLSAVKAILFWCIMPGIAFFIRLSQKFEIRSLDPPLHYALHKMIQDKSSSTAFHTAFFKHLILADSNARKLLLPVLSLRP